MHADLRLRKTAVPLPLQLRAILAAGKMAEEQASGAASLAGDDDWDAGELTRTMAAHGQRPAAGRHAPRLSVPTRAAAAVLLGLHLHLDLHAHAAGGGGEAAPEAEEVVERGAVRWI